MCLLFGVQRHEPSVTRSAPARRCPVPTLWVSSRRPQEPVAPETPMLTTCTADWRTTGGQQKEPEASGGPPVVLQSPWAHGFPSCRRRPENVPPERGRHAPVSGNAPEGRPGSDRRRPARGPGRPLIGTGRVRTRPQNRATFRRLPGHRSLRPRRLSGPRRWQVTRQRRSLQENNRRPLEKPGREVSPMGQKWRLLW